MIERLATRRAEKLAYMGRLILDRLEADSRLAEAAEFMKAIQVRFETGVDALAAAGAAEVPARRERDEAHRVLTVAVREFAFAILARNGNHHNVDPYMRYFPRGYREAMRLTPKALGTFAHGILAVLREMEKDPRTLTAGTQVEEVLNRFLAAEKAYQEAHSARTAAFALVLSERRAWARGVVKTKALAEYSCHYDRVHLRSIFGVLARRRRAHKSGPDSEDSGTNKDGPRLMPPP